MVAAAIAVSSCLPSPLQDTIDESQFDCVLRAKEIVTISLLLDLVKRLPSELDIELVNHLQIGNYIEVACESPWAVRAGNNLA